VIQRNDDTPESISQRLDLYESQTSPLLEFYGQGGRLVEIDGSRSPDEVFEALTVAIDAARKNS
jgi:adenylate kinase